MISSLDNKDKVLVQSCYCFYKSLIHDFSASHELSKSSIVDASQLLQTKETEDLGWLVIRRSLALCVNKDLARENLNGVMIELGLKSDGNIRNK